MPANNEGHCSTTDLALSSVNYTIPQYLDTKSFWYTIEGRLGPTSVNDTRHRGDRYSLNNLCPD